jgi:hypothetical protein
VTWAEDATKSVENEKMLDAEEVNRTRGGQCANRKEEEVEEMTTWSKKIESYNMGEK